MFCTENSAAVFVFLFIFLVFISSVLCYATMMSKLPTFVQVSDEYHIICLMPLKSQTPFPSISYLQPVEMKDGSIVINVRNQNNYHCRCRVVVRSRDGGESLPIDDLYFDTALVDPVVAAGALQKDGVLFFTNPSNDQHSKKC